MLTTHRKAWPSCTLVAPFPAWSLTSLPMAGGRAYAGSPVLGIFAVPARLDATGVDAIRVTADRAERSFDKTLRTTPGVHPPAG